VAKLESRYAESGRGAEVRIRAPANIPEGKELGIAIINESGSILKIFKSGEF
jgi:hypothetical protein